MIKLTLRTLPISTNRAYKSGNGRFYKSQEAKDSQEAMAWEARSQYRGKPLSGALICRLSFFWRDKRRHDLDNPCKALLDAFTGILWDDDSQIQELHITKAFSKENPRVEIEVVELP